MPRRVASTQILRTEARHNQYRVANSFFRNLKYMKKDKTPNYNILQERIDHIIGRFGLPKTLTLLNNFIDQTTLPVGATEKVKLTSQYLITQSIEIFELQEKQFFTSTIQEYREARMACFHLIQKFTGASCPRIAEQFGINSRSVRYSLERCRERLSVAFYYKDFVRRYETLEQRAMQFIAKLSSNQDS